MIIPISDSDVEGSRDTMKSFLFVVAILLSLISTANAQVIQVNIDFDELPVGTVVTNQYPNTVFSCEPGYEPRVGQGTGLCSPPNGVEPGVIGGPSDDWKPLFLDFPFPVNNLSLCVDEVRINAGGIIRVFEGGSFTEEVPYSCDWIGCPIDLTRFHNVTRLEMIPLTLGNIWDSFSFTYQDSSPIPTLNEVGVGVFAVLLAAVGAAFLWWRRS